MKMSIVIFSVVVVMAGCVSNQNKNIGVGVFEVVSRQCNAEYELNNTCKNIALVEFIYGKFFGIKDSEIALVVWLGDKDNDLIYQSRKVSQKISAERYPYILNISESEGAFERIRFNSLNDVIYEFGKNESYSVLFLHRIDKAEIQKYSKSYPE